jgi:8-oxo-dGTP pyrophosphatase MutT (NUDIX family)
MRVAPNAWVLPGGHLDAGESLEEGAAREIFEETGIHIESNQGVMSFQGQPVFVEPFFVYESAMAPELFTSE